MGKMDSAVVDEGGTSTTFIKVGENGNGVPFKGNPQEDGSSESGIDEAEFETAREESAKIFARNLEECTTFSFQDVLDSLSTKKVARTSLMSRVEINPLTRRLLLKVDRGNVRARYGYDVDKGAYLYPEEALYLLELGKAEIYSEHVSLSAQRARSLLLVAQRDETSDRLATCTRDEYVVYKYLSRMGYCLYRCIGSSDTNSSSSDSSVDISSQKSEPADVQVVKMDEDDDDIIVEGEHRTIDNVEEIDDIIDLEQAGTSAGNGGVRKGVKRKLPDDQLSVESDEIMDSYEENTHGNLEGINYSQQSDEGPDGYTVDEADSDVEIVDEVIYTHGGVEIQEISHSVGCQNEEFIDSFGEPVASTSKGPPVSQVLVDLVSSEDEQEDLKPFGNKIWSKFIPNSKLIFTIPPSSLIPQTIPSSDTIYEFDLKDKSDVSDLELEFLVDEVSLNDDFSESSQHYCNYAAQSWKEWRQSVFREARNVMNESLLASSEHINGEAAAKKLFLWQDNQMESHFNLLLTNKIIFEMYGPVGQNFSRMKAQEENPSYYVFITRQDESVPDFGAVGSHIDGVPILIAIVCDSGENDIVFMTADRSPLNSLF